MKTLDTEGINYHEFACKYLLKQGSGSESVGKLQACSHVMATNYTISGPLSNGLQLAVMVMADLF